MPEFLLSDHLRSTPSRTIGALLVAGYRRLMVRRAPQASSAPAGDARAASDANVYRAPSSRGFEAPGRAA